MSETLPIKPNHQLKSSFFFLCAETVNFSTNFPKYKILHALPRPSLKTQKFSSLLFFAAAAAAVAVERGCIIITQYM